jgi:speckle-type POZ protein
VTFVIGGEQFTAHRCVLAARSSTVFMAEVLGTGKESANEVIGTGKESAVGGGSRHVRVDGMAPRVFKALLRFIYTKSLSDELADHGDRITIARGLLVVADRYGMERLKLICSDMLCSYYISMQPRLWIHCSWLTSMAVSSSTRHASSSLAGC